MSDDLEPMKTIGEMTIYRRKNRQPGETQYCVFFEVSGDTYEKDFGRYAAAVRWCKQRRDGK